MIRIVCDALFSQQVESEVSLENGKRRKGTEVSLTVRSEWPEEAKILGPRRSSVQRLQA